MARIYKLPEMLANLIAAGEVVERPGSVIKELVENAIDAGAARITVEIKNGGVSYMRATDDGCGIFPEDVPTAFMRHATSKIHSESDLNQILTLGFRGEALAAVASVARVDMFTRTRLSDTGVQITLEGGEQTGFCETGCPVGTTIVIRDLFYNVPARAKFLKKDASEAAFIETVVSQAAISRPNVSFKLIKDGRESLFTQGDGKMLSAIYSVFGRDIASGLLPTAGQFGNISVDGFITPPGAGRASRSMQYFFVNGRPVRSRTLGAALEQAYKSRIPGGRYPACFLNVKLHPSTVDANVHPAKLEVKFSHERDVFSAIYHGVLTALEGSDSLLTNRAPIRLEPREDNVTREQQQIAVTRTGGTLTYGESFQGVFQKAASSAQIDYYAGRDRASETPDAPRKTEYLSPNLAPRTDYNMRSEPIHASERGEKPAPDNKASPPVQTGDVRLIGEAFGTYIIVQQTDDLWLIDKHAAHERIIYNSLLAGGNRAGSQTLIEPVAVTLSAPEKTACLENLGALSEAGFEIEDFGAGALIVRSLPAYLSADDAAFVLSHIAQTPSGAPDGVNPILHELLSGIACKAAIRAGDFTAVEEMESFARLVLSSPEVRSCPHGRPVVTRLERRALEKMFGRSGL